MQCSNKAILTLPVGARSSPLSQAQVKEIYEDLQRYHPHVRFTIHYLSTTGDQDQTTSLRTLDRTDFFTKEIDAWVLQEKGRVAIHSAKDLPIPLTKGLKLFCLTRGVDPSDSLVLHPHTALQSLPAGAIIATSSLRREQSVKQLRADLHFCDLRGTIEQRLAKLESGEADGIVVAEAALIRLGLTHLNRIRLPGTTAEGQGQLAVVGREEDQEIQTLFACLDVREYA
jgi:hydroxymethylbilane synthase